MRLIFLFLLLLNSISAWEYKSPHQIQMDLDAAEQQFSRALEIFNPWYTGPLLTPSATMAPPAMGNIQPYLFFNNVYGAYNQERKTVSLPNNLLNFNPVLLFITGVTDSMDVGFALQSNTNWQNGSVGGGFGDVVGAFGFLIQNQTLYAPKVKFTIQEYFPTGRYQNLDPNLLNVSGAGSYQTQFTLAAAKLMFWTTKHPVNARIALAYRIPLALSVEGYNAYGGGVGTKGIVKPGNTFSADLGIEISLTQRWVFANDFVYVSSSQTKFMGNPGLTPFGTPAFVGRGYSDQLSLAPAIEYNWSEYLGILAGVQFTVYGRNSANFASGIISFEWTFY